VELTDSEKTRFSDDWRTFRERNTNLIKHQASRPIFLSNPGPMYPVDTRQNEEGYRLEYHEHMV
jgi:hypothetical protein